MCHILRGYTDSTNVNVMLLTIETNKSARNNPFRFNNGTSGLLLKTIPVSLTYLPTYFKKWISDPRVRVYVSEMPNILTEPNQQNPNKITYFSIRVSVCPTSSELVSQD